MNNEHASVMYECDHMRPVVYVEGSWRHIGDGGRVGGRCGSTGYRVSCIVTGTHDVLSAVLHDPAAEVG